MSNQELFTKKFSPRLKEKTSLITWLELSVEPKETFKRVS
jgi:hypothetical protein